MAWTWSLRAVKSIQVLAEQWGIKEHIDAQDKADAASKTDEPDRPWDMDDVSFFDVPGAIDMGDALGDVNWLFDFGSPALLQSCDVVAPDYFQSSS